MILNANRGTRRRKRVQRLVRVFGLPNIRVEGHVGVAALEVRVAVSNGQFEAAVWRPREVAYGALEKWKNFILMLDGDFSLSSASKGGISGFHHFPVINSN